jgi:peroxiredoxin
MKILITFIFLVTSIPCFALSPEVRTKLFQDSIQTLKGTGIEKKAPAPGQIMKDLEIDGVKLSERLKKGPVLLTFYRGGWCPYCVKQLKEMQERKDEFTRLNIQIIAISPETKKEVAKTKNKTGLLIEMVSDNDFSLANALGLTFIVEPQIEEVYRTLGINLEENQGNKQNRLPVPATYLIARDRKILYGFVDADYTKRAQIKDILHAAQGI